MNKSCGVKLLSDRFYLFDVQELVESELKEDVFIVDEKDMWIENKPTDDFQLNQYVEYYLSLCDQFHTSTKIVSSIVNHLGDGFATEIDEYMIENLERLATIIFKNQLQTENAIVILLRLSTKEHFLQTFLNDYIELIKRMGNQIYSGTKSVIHDLLQNCLCYIAEVEIPIYYLLKDFVNIRPVDYEKEITPDYTLSIHFRKIFHLTYSPYYCDYDYAPVEFYELKKSLYNLLKNWNFQYLLDREQSKGIWGVDITLSPYLMLTFPSLLWESINGDANELVRLNEQFIHPIEDIDNFHLLKLLLSKIRDDEMVQWDYIMIMLKEYIGMLTIEGRTKFLSLLLQIFSKPIIFVDISLLIYHCIKLSKNELENRNFEIPINLIKKLILFLPRMLYGRVPEYFPHILYNLIIVKSIQRLDSDGLFEIVKKISHNKLNTNKKMLCVFCYECLIFSNPVKQFTNMVKIIRKLRIFNYSIEEEHIIYNCINSLKVSLLEKRQLQEVYLFNNDPELKCIFFSFDIPPIRWLVNVRRLIEDKHIYQTKMTIHDYYFQFIDFEKRVLQKCQKLMNQISNKNSSYCTKEFANETLSILLTSKSNTLQLKHFIEHFKFLSKINHGHYSDFMDHIKINDGYFSQLICEEWQAKKIQVQFHQNRNTLSQIFPSLPTISKFEVCHNIIKSKKKLLSIDDHTNKEYRDILDETMKESYENGRVYLDENLLWRLGKERLDIFEHNKFGFLRTVEKYLLWKYTHFSHEQLSLITIMSIFGFSCDNNQEENDRKAVSVYMNIVRMNHEDIFKGSFFNKTRLLEKLVTSGIDQCISKTKLEIIPNFRVIQLMVHDKDLLKLFYNHSTHESQFYQRMFHGKMIKNQMLNCGVDIENVDVILYLLSCQFTIEEICEKVFNRYHNSLIDYLWREYFLIILIFLQRKIDESVTLKSFENCRDLVLRAADELTCGNTKNYKYYRTQLYLTVFRLDRLYSFKYDLLEKTCMIEIAGNSKVRRCVNEIFTKCPIHWRTIPISIYFVLSNFQHLLIVQKAIDDYVRNESDEYEEDEFEENPEKNLFEFYFKSKPLENFSEFLLLCDIIEERLLIYGICHLSELELKGLKKLAENNSICYERLYRLYNQLILMRTDKVYSKETLDDLEIFIQTFICHLLVDKTSNLDRNKNWNCFYIRKRFDPKNRMTLMDLQMENIDMTTEYFDTFFARSQICEISSKFYLSLSPNNHLMETQKQYSLPFIMSCIKTLLPIDNPLIFLKFLVDLQQFFSTIQTNDRRLFLWFYYELRDLFDNFIFNPPLLTKLSDFYNIFMLIAVSFGDNKYSIELFQFILFLHINNGAMNGKEEEQCHSCCPLSPECNLEKSISFDLYIRSLVISNNMDNFTIINEYNELHLNNLPQVKDIFNKLQLFGWENMPKDSMHTQLSDWDIVTSCMVNSEWVDDMIDIQKMKRQTQLGNVVRLNDYVKNEDRLNLFFFNEQNNHQFDNGNPFIERLKSRIMEMWKDGNICQDRLWNIYVNPFDDGNSSLPSINHCTCPDIFGDYNVKKMLRLSRNIISEKWRTNEENRWQFAQTNSLVELMTVKFFDHEVVNVLRKADLIDEIILKVNEYPIEEVISASIPFINRISFQANDEGRDIVVSLTKRLINMNLKNCKRYYTFYKSLLEYYSIVYKNIISTVQIKQNMTSPQLEREKFFSSLSIFHGMAEGEHNEKNWIYIRIYLRITAMYLKLFSSNIEPTIILNFINALFAEGTDRMIDYSFQNELKEIDPKNFQMIQRYLFVQFSYISQNGKLRNLRKFFFEIIMKLVDDPTSEIYPLICYNQNKELTSDTRTGNGKRSDCKFFIPSKMSKYDEEFIKIKRSNEMDDDNMKCDNSNFSKNFLNELLKKKKENFLNIFHLDQFLKKSITSHPTNTESVQSHPIPLLSSEKNIIIDKYELHSQYDKQSIITFFGNDGKRYDRKLRYDSNIRNDFLMNSIMRISEKIVDVERSHLAQHVDKIIMMSDDYILQIHQPQISLKHYLYDTYKRKFPDCMQPEECYNMFKDKKINRLRTLTKFYQMQNPVLFNFFLEYCSTLNQAHHSRNNFIRSTAINNFYIFIFNIKCQEIQNIYINPNNGLMSCDSFRNMFGLRKTEKRWGDIPVRLTRNIASAFGSVDMVTHYNKFFFELSSIFNGNTQVLYAMAFMVLVEDFNIFEHQNISGNIQNIVDLFLLRQHFDNRIHRVINDTQQLTSKATNVVELAEMDVEWMPYL
ncbi:hypothetical protein SNEBB_009907 [Seison nebaliae]|nr:hypothetical protein SNEBB_009907 [Seison nebaliae]